MLHGVDGEACCGHFGTDLKFIIGRTYHDWTLLFIERISSNAHRTVSDQHHVAFHGNAAGMWHVHFGSGPWFGILKLGTVVYKQIRRPNGRRWQIYVGYAIQVVWLPAQAFVPPVLLVQRKNIFLNFRFRSDFIVEISRFVYYLTTYQARPKSDFYELLRFDLYMCQSIMIRWHQWSAERIKFFFVRAKYPFSNFILCVQKNRQSRVQSRDRDAQSASTTKNPVFLIVRICVAMKKNSRKQNKNCCFLCLFSST